MIPYGHQWLDDADVEAAVRVLRSDWLTQGPEVPAFERAVESLIGVRHAVAVNSGTSALHVACLALGVGAGDMVWTVPNTFVASANCACYCGGGVDFVDIDPRTWNMSVEKLAEKLVVAREAGTLPSVVIPVHFAGQPTEQEAIWDLAQQYGFRVLEDASHSMGAQRAGEPVGSCRWSDVTVFSLHPVKIVTSGEGGLAVTNRDEIAERMRMLRSHGITRDRTRFQAPGAGEKSGGNLSPDPWYYEQQDLGFNYRMTDIQAAVGRSQLNRLWEFVRRRNLLAERYFEMLGPLPVELPCVQLANRSAYHLYVVRLEQATGDRTYHRRVFDCMTSRGVGANVHYTPVHLQPYYRARGFTEGMFPESEVHGRSAITLPLYPAMSLEDQDCVVDALTEALN